MALGSGLRTAAGIAVGVIAAVVLVPCLVLAIPYLAIGTVFGGVSMDLHPLGGDRETNAAKRVALSMRGLDALAAARVIRGAFDRFCEQPMVGTFVSGTKESMH